MCPDGEIRPVGLGTVHALPTYLAVACYFVASWDVVSLRSWNHEIETAMAVFPCNSAPLARPNPITPSATKELRQLLSPGIAWVHGDEVADLGSHVFKGKQQPTLCDHGGV